MDNGTFIPKIENLDLAKAAVLEGIKPTNCKECLYGDVLKEAKRIERGNTIINVSEGCVMCTHKGPIQFSMHGKDTVCSAFRSAKEEVRKAFEEGR